MFFCYDNRKTFGVWKNGKKSKIFFIFPDFMGRGFSFGYFAENTVFHNWILSGIFILLKRLNPFSYAFRIECYLFFTEGFNYLVHISFHYLFNIMPFFSDAMVGDSVLGEIVSSYFFGAFAGADLFAAYVC